MLFQKNSFLELIFGFTKDRKGWVLWLFDLHIAVALLAVSILLLWNFLRGNHVIRCYSTATIITTIIRIVDITVHI